MRHIPARGIFPAAFAALATLAHAQLAPDAALKSFQLADPALRVELVAAEPLVQSPCAIAFDERGRLFVAENRGYPIGPKAGEKPAGVIAMLEDTDGDGRMDKRTTFADALTFPNGVMPWQGGVIVTCAPDVLFLKDTDGDGVADERKVLLTGFATSGSTQLRVNCPTLGPDGWIYFAAGLSGGEITAPGSGKPAVKMTGDLRWQPFTGEIENVDGRSQFGLSFDDFGRRFICMNRVPVQHVVLQSKWLRRNPNLAFSDTVQDCNERTVKTGLKGGGDGVRLFPISSNITTADSHAGSFSAACAITIWRGGALPDAYRGGALTCDPTGNLIHADKLTPRGATFAATAMFDGREFLASRDDWFRPVFLACGPDGALYVADMVRKVIEHPDYLPEEIRKRTDFETGKAMGRIWRIVENVQRPTSNARRPKAEGTHEGATAFGVRQSSAALSDAANSKTAPQPNSEAQQSGRGLPHSKNSRPFDDASALVKALDDANGWTRQTAFRLLWQDRSDEAKNAIHETAYDQRSAAGTAAVIRLLDTKGDAEIEMLQAQFDDSRSDVLVNVLGLDIVRPAKEGEEGEWTFDRYLGKCAGSASAEVRFWTALALGREANKSSVNRLVRIALRDESDRWTRAAVVSAIAGREAAFLDDYFGERIPISPSGMALLENVGRSLADIPSLRAAIKGVDMMGHDWLACACLALGFAERSGKRLVPEAPNDWVDVLLQIAAETSRENGTSREAMLLSIRLLGHGNWENARDALRDHASNPKDDEFRFAAIRAFASFAEPEVPTTLLAAGAWPKYTPAMRETIIGALLANPSHVSGILDAIETSRLPAGAVPTVRRGTFLTHTDAAIRARAEKLFAAATPGDRTKAFDDAKAALSLTANAEHGREIFKQLCATCHRLDREGYAVGPDLLDMRNQPKESILFHIVVPEAEVAPAFAPYLIETKDGRALAGILASETPASLTLRLPLGVEEAILRTNVARLEALPGSLMPAGLEAAMSRQDLADLLAFLKGER